MVHQLRLEKPLAMSKRFQFGLVGLICAHCQQNNTMKPDLDLEVTTLLIFYI